MKKSINITKTFQQIHQLPLEVSFEQVEQWVLEQPLKKEKRTAWNFDFWTRFFAKWTEN